MPFACPCYSLEVMVKFTRKATLMHLIQCNPGNISCDLTVAVFLVLKVTYFEEEVVAVAELKF